MAVPRQERSAEIAETGRVNQRRRTRAAIVEAAKQLFAEGTTPTVAQAAEAALVSRTTAYRYFPTQESLLLELSVNVDVDDIEALVATPVPPPDATARAVEVLDMFNRHVAAEEVRYRTAMRLYLDLWLAATAAGDDAPVVREGRRRRWFETVLAPVEEGLGPENGRRVVAALSVLAGPEAFTVLRDICGMTPDDALDTAEWIARTVLAATLPA